MKRRELAKRAAEKIASMMPPGYFGMQKVKDLSAYIESLLTAQARGSARAALAEWAVWDWTVEETDSVKDAILYADPDEVSP
jgi:hypothetical protein